MTPLEFESRLSLDFMFINGRFLLMEADYFECNISDFFFYSLYTMP